MSYSLFSARLGFRFHNHPFHQNGEMGRSKINERPLCCLNRFGHRRLDAMQNNVQGGFDVVQ